jgi:multiple sugar transport system substrate-binding protein
VSPRTRRSPAQSRPRAAIRELAATGLIVVAVAAGLFAGGCGGTKKAAVTNKTGGGETIFMWHGNVDLERTATDAAVNAFNATGAGFKVKAVFEGNSDFMLQKVLTGVAAGKYPDVVYLYGSWMANIAKSPKLATLDDLIASSPGIDWNDFFPAEREAATVNGKIVGIPALVDNLALVYNKQLFDQAGVAYPTADWTWTDFRAAAQKLTNASTKQFGWAYVNDGSEDTVWRFWALLWQAGGDILTADNTKAAFNSAAGLKAMLLLRDMAVTDKSVYLDSGNGNYLNLFNSGKIAMLWTGPWDIATINKDVAFGVQILPADMSHATISGPDNWVILDNGAQNVQDAFTFMTWFTSPKVHLQYCIATSTLPLRTSETKLPEYRSVYLKKYPSMDVYVKNMDNATKARPNVASYPEISAAIGQAVQAVLLGKAEPQAALSSAEQQINSILATGGQ